MSDLLTDEELIAVPEAGLRPGELRRAFLVRAQHHEKEDQ